MENHKHKQPNISRCEAMQPLQGKILSHNISKSVLGCLDFQVGNTSVFIIVFSIYDVMKYGLLCYHVLFTVIQLQCALLRTSIGLLPCYNKML